MISSIESLGLFRVEVLNLNYGKDSRKLLGARSCLWIWNRELYEYMNTIYQFLVPCYRNRG